LAQLATADSYLGDQIEKNEAERLTLREDGNTIFIPFATAKNDGRDWVT